MDASRTEINKMLSQGVAARLASGGQALRLRETDTPEPEIISKEEQVRRECDAIVGKNIPSLKRQRSQEKSS
jgi:hypothetical protein